MEAIRDSGRAIRGSDLMMFMNILQLWCLGMKCVDYIVISHIRFCFKKKSPEDLGRGY